MGKFLKKYKSHIVCCFISAVITTIFLIFVFKGWDWLPKENYIFNFDTFISFIGVVGSIGAIFIVVWSTNKQISNQNKEANRPYLISHAPHNDVKTSWISGKRSFNCKNTGKGICVNIATWSKENDSFEKYSNVSIDSAITFKVKAETDEDIKFMIFYSDILSNVYPVLMIYDKYNSKNEFRLLSEKSQEFKSYISSNVFKGVLDKYNSLF